MTYPKRIARDPAICAGQFPSHTEEDVRAVIAFAAASAAEDLPAPSPNPPSVKVA